MASMPSVPADDLAHLLKNTTFSEGQIRKLFQNFVAISASMQKADTIELNEFMAAMDIKDEDFASRLFSIFDLDHNSEVDFREFVLGLSKFTATADADEMLRVSFCIYDVDGDGYITKEELYEMLKGTLGSSILSELPEDQILGLVEFTFKSVDANSDGRIDFSEYRQLARNNPVILQSLTFNSAILD